MQIAKTPVSRECNEADIYNALFDFSGKHILELGCGAAAATRSIAAANPTCHIDALEVDEIQHGKNLQIIDLSNVSFKLAGAEAIPAEDHSYDIVFMFKSLHHVPKALMDSAMREIKRVLRPGGIAYISEPVYAGDYNAMMRLFHDEKEVREYAYAAVKKAVDTGAFVLKDQIFFNSVRKFKDFQQFEDEVLGATYTDHQLDEETLRKVKQIFTGKLSEDGAVFTRPIRVDVLVNPSVSVAPGLP